MSKTSYMTSPYPKIYQYSQNDYGVMLAYVKQDHARGALHTSPLGMKLRLEVSKKTKMGIQGA